MMAAWSVFGWFLLQWSLCAAATANINCFGDGEAAGPVDWFIVYKLPKNSSDSFMDGYNYFYMDERKPYFSASENSLRAGGQSAVERTLEQIYDNKAPMYVMYNDRPNDTCKSNSRFGHAKGVAAFGSNSGFWMVHSVPMFPNVTAQGYDYTASSTIYGQVFLCMTFSAQDFGPIVAQLLFRQVYVYEKKGFTSSSHTPSLIDIIVPAQHRPVIQTMLNEIELHNVTISKSKAIQSFYPIGSAIPAVYATVTAGKQKVLFFSKTSAFGANFYRWMAQALKVKKLKVQTWRNGNGGDMSSYCPSRWKDLANTVVEFQPEIENIERIRFTGSDKTEDIYSALSELRSSSMSGRMKSVADHEFKYTKDHSKWAIGEGKWKGVSYAVTCIGDLNRILSQGQRGGGAVCILEAGSEKSIYNSFKSLIVDTEEC